MTSPTLMITAAVILTLGSFTSANSEVPTEAAGLRSPDDTVQHLAEYKEQDTRQDPQTLRVQPSGRVFPRGRGLGTPGDVKEMLAPQRYPRPKKPMGNDIGEARLLEHTTSSETPVNVSSPADKEVDEMIESMPQMPHLKLDGTNTSLDFIKDPEEESLDARITEVARQLAETGLRREFEEKKLGHNLPITLQDKTIPPLGPTLPDKTGKSFPFPVQTLPLVSRLPPETAQLQLITEVHTIPQHIYKEGFYQATPAPELSGPLLGGPPLKNKARSIEASPSNQERKSLRLQRQPSNDYPEYLRVQGYLVEEAPQQMYPLVLNLGPAGRMLRLLEPRQVYFAPQQV